MAMWSQDLAADQLVARRIMGEPLVFYRTVDGRPAALLDRCAHRWAPLSKGAIVGDRVRCPYHGLEYDQHGMCVLNPHPNYKIPPAMRVRSYPLAEKHSIVWIWLGAGRPDPALIPDFSWLDPEAGTAVDRRAYLPMECAWNLMVDNLLDMSHVPVLHDGNLGNPDMIGAEILVEPYGPRGVSVSRSYTDIRTTAVFDMMTFGKYPRIDLEAMQRWEAPACIFITGIMRPAGGSEAQATGVKTCHFITPETETTSHYWFAAERYQPVRGTLEEEAAVLPRLAEVRRQIFEDQDGAIIAAQQARIIEAGGPEHYNPVLIGADAGVERAHRILRELHEQEQRELVASS
jgi:vanillate O-demethylase monooxygenase subunit